MSEGALSASILAEKERIYADDLKYKCSFPRNYIGFIDGNALGIARPGRNDKQNAAYN